MYTVHCTGLFKFACFQSNSDCLIDECISLMEKLLDIDYTTHAEKKMSLSL